MTDNSEILLKTIIEDNRLEKAPDRSVADYFEIFTADQITKDFEPSYEEIEAGIVDGEHDGGIDSFYTFVNSECIGEEIEFTVPKRDAIIDLVVIQSKSANGFSEASIDKLITSVANLLDLSKKISALTQYNEKLKERADIFRKTYQKVVSKFPKLRIQIFYASAKSAANIHKNTIKKSEDLIERIQALYDEAEVSFEFIGAKELTALARKKPNQTFDLRFNQSLNGSNGYVALVGLTDFYKFLLGGGDKIRYDLFESNVRDYQGTTEVNLEITNTLKGRMEEDFWWFNNGVTILCSRATSASNIITIENPQIVNGLQTSSELGRFFQDTKRENDTRSVMVKVVFSDNEETRDKIIKSTNSQNQVPPASLRATDKIQRDIEHHFKSGGLFYDRRKNFYKNEGKPAGKIISISLLAQAVMTLFKSEPDNARARPSSLIKEDKVYNQLFSESFPLDSYYVAADTIRRIETLLKKTDSLAAKDRNNIRFYVLYWLCMETARSSTLNPSRISSLRGKISDDSIALSIDKVWNEFKNKGGSDQLAKGSEFKLHLKSILESSLKNIDQ